MPCDCKWKVLSEPPLYTLSLDHLEMDDYSMIRSSLFKATCSRMRTEYCALALGIKHERTKIVPIWFLSSL